MKSRKLAFVLGGTLLAGVSMAQVPDLLNALDVGGRSMGAAGAFYPTSSDTLSNYYNPAGLGYMSKGQLGVTYRNLPKSKTKASNEFDDLTLDTNGQRGGMAFTHFGVAFPFDEGKRGTLGLSYTIGGFIDDSRTNDGVLVGGVPVNEYREKLRAKSEYFSIGYGKSSAAQDFSWGVGLQFVRQHIADDVILVDSGNNVLLDANNSDTGSGIGFLIGVQFVPKGNSNMSIGLSYRSEINLSGNEDTESIYDKIPARLMGGIALRQDGLRGGRDFLVYGAQVQHFFEGESSAVFDRSAQTAFGLGLEYNYQFSGYRIPIRFGFNIVPSGGDGFDSRNGFTFGFGFRPLDNRYGIDVNFATQSSGGYDMGINLNYRFGN
ncbi:MAG TPA: hypothetical protein VJ835_08910 [Fimbriimonadaceae bacterium]|nr:hypothetical protein [Fimbriimonadaceae bacterium]